VYHALFLLDLHLSDSPKGFRQPKPFRILGVDFSGKGYEKSYSRHYLKRYVEYSRRSVRANAGHVLNSILRGQKVWKGDYDE